MAYEKDPEFAARVGRPLMETSWGLMVLAAHNSDEDNSDIDERAGVLARVIGRRLTDLLKRDPVVTAHALAKHDRNLPRNLMNVWNGSMAMPASRPLTEPEMQKQAETLRRRADLIDAMLAEREKDRPEALAAAARKHEEKQGKQAGLWVHTSTEKPEYKF